MNWRLCPICETIYASFTEEKIYECNKCVPLYISQREISEILLRQGLNFENRLLPLLITPTFLKNNQNPQLNIILRTMYNVLRNADKIQFIGYSLPISDHDIRNILIQAYSVNRDIKVDVILKESVEGKKKELRDHYQTIYDKSRLHFVWGGF